MQDIRDLQLNMKILFFQFFWNFIFTLQRFMWHLAKTLTVSFVNIPQATNI